MNQIKTDLIKLGISTKESFKIYHPTTRDREDVDILKCDKSGVLITDRTDHITQEYYETRENYYSEDELGDTERRASLVNQYVNKSYLDIGTGEGKILEKINCKKVDGVEPQNSDVEYRDILEVKTKYDTISMFHVLEHIPEQIKYLKTVNDKTKSGGYLIIEVPHAKNYLIENCEAFRDFTFWSEHLILHTAESLTELLLHTGYDEIQIVPVQRYTLANNSYWMEAGKPGGHKIFTCDENTEQRHAEKMMRKGQTDTLIAIARKP